MRKFLVFLTLLASLATAAPYERYLVISGDEKFIIHVLRDYSHGGVQDELFDSAASWYKLQLIGQPNGIDLQLYGNTQSLSWPGTGLMVAEAPPTQSQDLRHQIIGTMGITTPPITEPNPMEVRLSYIFPKSAMPKEVLVPSIGKPFPGSGDAQDWYSKQTVPAEAVAEFKKMARDKNRAPKSLFTAMYVLGEYTGLTFEGRHAIDLPDTKSPIIFPGHYIGETDFHDVALKMQEKEGWKIVGSQPNPDIPGNTTFTLTIERDRLVQDAIGDMHRRNGETPLFIVRMRPEDSWDMDWKARLIAEPETSPGRLPERWVDDGQSKALSIRCGHLFRLELN